MRVIDGQPEFTWCGEEVVLSKIQVFYAEEGSSGSTLVLEGEGTRTLETGDQFSESLLSSEWVLDRNYGEVEERKVNSVGLNIYFDQEAGAPRGTLLAKFDSRSEESVLESSERYWVWANGETSERPCGMSVR